LKEFAEENGKPYRELSAEGMQALTQYDWPGNVRELRTAIEHGVVMSNGPKITLRHMPAFVKSRDDGGRSGGGQAGIVGSPEGSDLNLDAVEQDLIRRALGRTEGNRTEAAKLLGISRRTLQRKLKAFQTEKRD
jgi:two-component system response regulator AtoC